MTRVRRAAPRGLGLVDRLALSLPEAAAALGVSENHLRNLRHELPVVHLGGRLVVPVDALRDWLRAKVKAEENRVDSVARQILESLSIDNH